MHIIYIWYFVIVRYNDYLNYINYVNNAIDNYSDPQLIPKSLNNSKTKKNIRLIDKHEKKDQSTLHGNKTINIIKIILYYDLRLSVVFAS